MCRLLCYTVYKLCIMAACLRPESWLIQLCTTACLCHGHSCFINCMLYTAACFMSWTLLFCVKDTAASYIVCYICTAAYVCHGHCCFIFCMLCTATCVVPWVATPALCQGHCCLIYCMPCIYCHMSMPRTLLFVPRILLLRILYAVYLHMLCVMGTATLSQGHCCFI